jgi:transposase
MSVKIENPASCAIRLVIKLFNAKNIHPAEIYEKFCEVYGENVMSDGVVRRWCRMFSERRTNVHDGDRSVRPSLVTAYLLDQVNEKIGKNRFTFFSTSIGF